MSIRNNEFVSVFLRVFDWSFTSFITPYLLKVTYPFILAVGTVGAVILVMNQYSQDMMAGIGATMLAFILWPLGVIVTRIYFECLAALMLTFEKISEDAPENLCEDLSWQSSQPQQPGEGAGEKAEAAA